MAKVGRDRTTIEDENGETLEDLRVQKAKRRDGKTEYEIHYVITPRRRSSKVTPLGDGDLPESLIFW